ncbi:sensor domain-containing diguanylate cyclase [Aurantimonas sp. VKM B-3413]|uniref:sensor domain-containing diguanylate cyclase n=1 Tax=Aurantimonas sp. VKM B-3413 TaxID=2779401 RepID=UPI001E39459D|nr:sensor domain-containing diguanylate cyclase [Aurantimonas sp. VKM B-3413]MCB8839620.1 sensor domain-containing diguanylate cyclase [Aurantimonas sp. VKM B-3413]
MFALAPVPLWIEDFSGVKALFESWRGAGVIAIREHLRDNPDLVAAAARQIKILAVNQRTLMLFEAASFEELVANIDVVFSGEMMSTHIDELNQLWDGAEEFTSLAVNYTLSGRRLDVQLKARILPGHERDWSRVLLSTEDVTEREEGRRLLASSEAFSRGLFEHSPISLWVEDFSVVKDLMDEVRERGVTDFRTFLDVHPEFVVRCMSEIRVIDVNWHTLELFKAADKSDLMGRLGEVFRDDMEQHFREQLIDLWQGQLFQQREVVNYSLDGEELHVHMQFSVFPGREADWSLVQVALTDITARKKAEAYLEFLGKHDILTKLYNRSFFVDELNRLERKGPAPVTVIVADLNGLKAMNDALGHAAGDALLRRAGEVLREGVQKPHCAARIGGDEFVILMPATGEAEAMQMIADIEELVEVNNQFYSGPALSFSLGLATSLQTERLEETVKRADKRMYEAKRAYYEKRGEERRKSAKD